MAARKADKKKKSDLGGDSKHPRKGARKGAKRERVTRRGEKFDDTVRHTFCVELRSSPIAEPVMAELTVEPPSEKYGRLTFDHVLEAAYSELESRFPERYYPEGSIGDVKILHEGKWYPVVSEGDYEGIERLKKDPSLKMFLMLPDATYSISDEYRMYEKMCELGLIDPAKAPFDADKMKSLIDMEMPGRMADARHK